MPPTCSNPFDGLPALLTEREVARLTSGVTRWRLEAKGLFPKRIKIGEKRIVWSSSEIRAWFAERCAERDGGEAA
jgi:predicted DNA-binding transcriptional regulator AlpA